MSEHTITVSTMEHRQDSAVEIDSRNWAPWVSSVDLDYIQSRGRIDDGSKLYLTLSKRETPPRGEARSICYVLEIYGAYLKPPSVWSLAVRGYLPPYPGDHPDVWGIA